MVLMRQWRPKERHDAIAHHLVDGALIAMDGRHQAFQHRVQELSGLLRITIGQQLHGAFEVRKQHGDLLALAFQRTTGGENFFCQIGRSIGEGSRCGCWGRCSSRGRGCLTDPDQHRPALIAGEALALNELVFERFQVRGIELKLQLEGPIRQPAPLAQQRNRLIHHRDKVHPRSSLSGVLSEDACTSPSYHKQQGGH